MDSRTTIFVTPRKQWMHLDGLWSHDDHKEKQ